MTLPHVSLETIQQVGAKILKDKESLFKEMAISNPELYSFAYEMMRREESTKDTMFGVLVAVYSCLEVEMEKGKKNRKRLRHADKSLG